jgi:hypothetical protein
MPYLLQEQYDVSCYACNFHRRRLDEEKGLKIFSQLPADKKIETVQKYIKEINSLMAEREMLRRQISKLAHCNDLEIKNLKNKIIELEVKNYEYEQKLKMERKP